MIEKSKLKQLEKVAKNNNLDFLILFGSYSKNKERENSDVDFAYFSNNVPKIDDLELMDEISEVFEHKKEIDLINLNRLDLSCYLVFRIFREGFPIYIKDKNLFLSKKEETYFNYVDYKRFDKIHENILKKGVSI
jgi:predicted nucleotidyltransferase